MGLCHVLIDVRNLSGNTMETFSILHNSKLYRIKNFSKLNTSLSPTDSRSSRPVQFPCYGFSIFFSEVQILMRVELVML